jgi:CHAT domain-containing protein/tetratricopeptide (TPR) repeat protein
VLGRVALVLGLAFPLGSGCSWRAADDPPGARRLTVAVDSLNRLGWFLEASRAAEQQLQLRLRALGPRHLLVAESKHRLAETLLQQGLVERAHALHGEALAVRRRQLPKNHPLLGQSLVYMAVAEKRYSVNLLRPLDLYKEGLTVLRTAHGDTSLEVGNALNALGNMQRRLWMLDEARSSLELALAIRRRLLGEGHANVAESAADLALIHLQEDHAAAAEELLRPALESRVKVLGADHPDLAFTTSLLAAACLIQEKYREAEHYYRRTIRTYENFRARIAPGYSRNRRYTLVDNSMLAATLLLAGRAREAWPHVESGLSRALVEELIDKGTYRYRAAQVEDVPPFVATLPHVQAALDPHTAMIGWLDMNPWGKESRSWAYVIRDRGDVRWVPLSSPASVAIGNQVHRALTDAAEWPLTVTSNTRFEFADQLYADKWAALEPELAGVRRLVILASANMGMVPVEAIRDPQGNYVGDRYEVSYTPSATVFAWLRQRGAADPAPRSREGLLVGDPAFSAQQARAMAREAESRLHAAELSPRTSLPEARVLRSAAVGSLDALERLPRLPWTRHEVETIRSMFPRSTVLMGRDATKQKFLQAVLSSEGRPRIIHFATHGVSDMSLPDGGVFVLSRSTRKDADDCLLRPGEVEALDLDVDLVSMSSCSSYGTHYWWSGYVGMGNAFLVAGARNVLVSFWRVEDRAAALLVEEFYRNHLERNRTMSESLQLAKRYLRNYTTRDGKRPYAHPAYWSAFILVGSGS